MHARSKTCGPRCLEIPSELERLYPRTAAELFSWGKSWLQTCENAFAGLDVDPTGYARWPP